MEPKKGKFLIGYGGVFLLSVGFMSNYQKFGWLLWLFSSVIWAESYEALEKKLVFRTLAADFTQVVMSSDHRVLSESRGELLAKGDKLVWRTTLPYKQDVFVRGDWVELVDYDFETVQKNKMTNQLGQLPLLLLTGNWLKAREHYKVSSLEGGGFSISPLGTLGENFKKAEIYFRDGVLSKMVITDSFSQITRIEFLRVHLNGVIGDTLLMAKYPKHFDTIE